MRLLPAQLLQCAPGLIFGRYKKAREGKIPEFTGISAPYEEPRKPEIHIKSHETSVEDAVKIIVKYLEDKGYLTPPAEVKDD